MSGYLDFDHTGVDVIDSILSATEIESLRAALKKAKWMLERDYIDDQKMSVIRECEKALGEE